MNCTISFDGHPVAIVDTTTHNISWSMDVEWSHPRVHVYPSCPETRGTETCPQWVALTGQTTPSGKTVFVCTHCGRKSVTPDKHCGPIRPFAASFAALSGDKGDA